MNAAVTITVSTSLIFARLPVKTQHELATQLWATGVTAARLLSTLLCKPKAFSAAELDAMIRDIASPKLLDWFIERGEAWS
jgi:3-methyladenine DNA glycosylase AlkD